MKQKENLYSKNLELINSSLKSEIEQTTEQTKKTRHRLTEIETATIQNCIMELPKYNIQGFKLNFFFNKSSNNKEYLKLEQIVKKMNLIYEKPYFYFNRVFNLTIPLNYKIETENLKNSIKLIFG